MMGQVDGENQFNTAKAMNDAGLDKAEAKQETAAKNPKSETKPATKPAAKPAAKKETKGDLTLEQLQEQSPFTRLKLIL